MTWLIRFLIFALLFVVARTIIGRLFGSSGGRRREIFRQSTQQPEIKTVGQTAVKDPQCGIYVDKSLAVSAQSGGQTHYFCSERCRDEFLARFAGD